MSPVGIYTSRKEANYLIKHFIWIVPVGVAAGFALPLLVPAPKHPKAPPTPPPPQPVVTVDGFELKPRQVVSAPVPSIVSESPVVVDASDSSDDSLATNAAVVTDDAVMSVRHRRRARRVPRIDPRRLRQIQMEDSRAFEAADRLLQYERRGA